MQSLKRGVQPNIDVDPTVPPVGLDWVATRVSFRVAPAGTEEALKHQRLGMSRTLLEMELTGQSALLFGRAVRNHERCGIAQAATASLTSER